MLVVAVKWVFIRSGKRDNQIDFGNDPDQIPGSEFFKMIL